MTKYVCMMDGCDFVSSDVEEAREHIEMGDDHIIAELSNDEEGVYCKTFK